MTEYPWFAHYDPGVPRTLAPYPRRTLLDYLDDALRERPDAPAVLFKGRAISWNELARASDAFAAALVSLGVKRGDRVAALLPNSPQFLVAELAAWKVGAVFAPLNPIYTEEELTGPLNTIDARVAVVLDPFYERVKRVQSETPLTRIVTTSIKEYFPFLLRAAYTLFLEWREGNRAARRDGDLAMHALLGRLGGERAVAERPSPDDTAILLMSGGTTGAPKCVPGEHRALVMSGLQMRAWVAAVLPPWEGVFMVPLPLFHSYGTCALQSSTIIGHNPLALIPNPRDIDDIVKSITSVKPVLFAGVPTLYNALVNHPDVLSGRARFSSLRLCVSGAAPLMAETKRRFEEVTGARIVEGYALTESLIAAAVNPVKGASKIGSVGMPLPDVEVKIVDADDPAKEVPVREVGEMLLRGPQIMKGYWRDAEATVEIVYTDAAGVRWLRTGDLGYLDEDGYLFLVDRKKELMKPNGMQVWPREVEEAIAAHPAVAEVGVRSFPDAAHGEIAVAFVVLRPGMAATAQEIREYCKQHLAFYKVPARVVFRSELPKSLVGKVLRRKLELEGQER